MKWIKENNKNINGLHLFLQTHLFLQKNNLNIFMKKLMKKKVNYFLLNLNEKRHNIFGLMVS
jgi:hypothetical protein